MRLTRRLGAWLAPSTSAAAIIGVFHLFFVYDIGFGWLRGPLLLVLAGATVLPAWIGGALANCGELRAGAPNPPTLRRFGLAVFAPASRRFAATRPCRDSDWIRNYLGKPRFPLRDGRDSPARCSAAPSGCQSLGHEYSARSGGLPPRRERCPRDGMHRLDARRRKSASRHLLGTSIERPPAHAPPYPLGGRALL